MNTKETLENMADPYLDGKPRYNTEVINNYYYKYREPQQIARMQTLFYGSDTDLIYRSKKGLMTGTIIGVGVAISVSVKPDIVFSNVVERSCKHGLPWVIVGTTYGVGTGLSASFRNKDGPLNHAVGGFAAGTFLGSWYKSTHLGISTALLFAAMGAAYKALFDNDWLPRSQTRRHNYATAYRDGWLVDRPDPEGVRDENSDPSIIKV